MAVIHPIKRLFLTPIFGVRVVDLVASHLFRGLTIAELAVNFVLDLGQVHAA